MMPNTEMLTNVQTVEMPNYEREIIRIIRGNDTPPVMKDKLMAYHENSIAAALSDMSVSERQRLYRILDVDDLSDVIEYAEESAVSGYLEEMDIKKKVAVLTKMDADKAVLLLEQLDKKERETLIELLGDDVKKDIALISSFDEDQIGSKMTTNFIALHADLSIKQAMKELIRQAADHDNIATLYVVDDNNIFRGAIVLKDLIVAREGSPLEDLIITSYPFVYAKEEIEDSIPAFDEENKLLGIITAQDIIKVVDDEMGEDYAKLAGLAAEEDLAEPLKESVKKRLPWLVILLGLGLVVSSVVGLFEAVMAQITIAVFFQSLILDMSGNVGTQSLAVTIRVLMDENLTGKQKARLVFKEGRIGLTNGLLLGSLSVVFIGFYIHFSQHATWQFSFGISVCIGLALVLALVISSLIGTVVPIFFKKIKIDPAVASGPLITTLNDLVAVITYYGLVWFLLIEVMHIA